MIPPHKSSEFFGFFSIFEKFAGIAGPATARSARERNSAPVSRSSGMLHGVTSFQDDATATWGLSQSASVSSSYGLRSYTDARWQSTSSRPSDAIASLTRRRQSSGRERSAWKTAARRFMARTALAVSSDSTLEDR